MDAKISALSELTSPASLDELPVVDKSDTTQAATGTTKKILYSTLVTAFTPADASTTAKGIVELATSAETITGTDTVRAVTPAGAAAAYQPLDSDLTNWAGKTTPSGTVVGTTDSQTMINKGIDASSNTITNITAAMITNRTRSIWLPVSCWGAVLGSPVRSVDSTDNTVAWLFDAAASEAISSEFFVVPKDFVASSNIDVIAYFAMVSATSGNVVIQTQSAFVTATESITGANDIGSVTVSVPGTADTLKSNTWSGVSGLTAGDIIKMRFIRLGNDASDTATGDLQFLGMEIQYTADM